MIDIHSLGYLVLQSPALDKWREYGQDIVGMMAVDLAPDMLGLRMDERPFRLMIISGEAEAVAAVGWEVVGSAELDSAKSELEGLGLEPRDATADECALRRVSRLVTFTDPGGTTCELFYQPHLDHSKFISRAGVQGFVTGRHGMGHVVLAVPDLEAAQRFYLDVMGFRLSDTMKLGRSAVDVRFLHCNARHHSLALTPGSQSALVHFMVEVDDLDDVGRAFDRHVDAGWAIRAGLGRHSNDLTVSFYAETPSGVEIEFGWGSRLVDDQTWTTSATAVGSIWGHRRAR
jgi:3,4-dihydroxy-9,10-secoandrosta-1,3,5(10)-triene-9,17-dione 4,5-dioxygenase